MEGGAERLAQYAAYGAARLHFSRLFFQTVAFVLAFVLAGAIGFRGVAEPLAAWLLIAAGLVLIQAGFITWRLLGHERAYERLLQRLEESFGGDLRQPASGRLGAKMVVVLSLLAAGGALALAGALREPWVGQASL